MKKTYTLFLIIGLYYSVECNSQITYEKGYFINNSDRRVECLIRNIDWKNNPREFEYKASEQSEKEALSIESVKEFGIYNFSKYIRFDINMDRSSSQLDLMSHDKKPILKKETLFLKVLIEGEASLFVYKEKGLVRYFFQTSSNNIDQLIYKEYITSDGRINTNNEFRRQLYTNLKCGNISMNDLAELDYKKNALVKLFNSHNICNGSAFVNYAEKEKPNSWNINIRPGLSHSSLDINNSLITSRSTDYGNVLTYRMGVELEFILEFNNNKWAAIIEPTYQYFKAEDENITNLSRTNVDYKSIEFPVGIRHYFFLNNNSKIFINGSFIYNIALNSNVRNLDVNSGSNLGFGIGYNFNNRYSLEFRYYTNKDILYSYNAWTPEFKTLSIIFGYKIL